MYKKRTLNIDNELITFAHTYSRQNGLSVSKLFEQYFSQLKIQEQLQTLHTKIHAFFGIASVSKEVNCVLRKRNAERVSSLFRKN